MKRMSSIIVALFAVISFAMITSPVEGARMRPGLMEYEVISIEPGSWVVTAKEVASGDVVKFKLPPSVFHGKTFDADMARMKKGRRFSVRGQRNARLNELKLSKALPGRKNIVRRTRPRRFAPASQMLPWKILNVNPRMWIVTAKHSKTGKVAKFKVDPSAFRGFRFHANLRSIRKGQGFSIVTPNNAPMPNACTLLEMKK